MAVVLVSILRLMRDIDYIMPHYDAIISLWFLFVIISIIYLGFDPSDEDLEEFGIFTEPRLAGILAMGAYIHCEPVNVCFAWFRDLFWWFWAAYLTERL